MGVYLSKANTTKESDDGGDAVQSCTRYGVSAMQGWRQGMEDAHITQPLIGPVTELLDREVSLYGVFDGHGGATVSQWIARHMEPILAASVNSAKAALVEKQPETLEKTELPTEVVVLCEALQQCFLKLDAEMQSPESREEIKEIFLATQSKAKEEEPDTGDEANQPYKTLLSMSSNPRTLLQALLIGSGNRSPTIRMVEQDGEQYFQINPPAEDDDEEERFRESVPDAEEEQELESEKPSVAEEDGEKQEISLTGEAHISNPSRRSPRGAGTGAPADATAPAVPADPVLIAEEVPAAISAVPHVDVVDDAEEHEPRSAEEANMLNRNTLPAWAPETTGAAAIVAAVVGGEQPFLVTANAGDSRCVLCRGGTAIGMSLDHKPHLPGELDRITKAGGTVLAGRVDGNLNLSRTIGDLFYKGNTKLGPEEQKITAFPDVRVIPLTKDDEFVILACDGIWDCVSNEEAVKFVRERLGMNPDETKLSKICEELCDFCLADNPMNSDGGIGCDNMTCIIVLLNKRLREQSATSSQVGSKLYESPLTNQMASTESTDTKVTDAMVGA